MNKQHVASVAFGLLIVAAGLIWAAVYYLLRDPGMASLGGLVLIAGILVLVSAEQVRQNERMSRLETEIEGLRQQLRRPGDAAGAPSAPREEAVSGRPGSAV